MQLLLGVSSHLLVVSTLQIPFLLLQLAHLCTELLGDFYTGSHFLLHATLISIKFL